jgi:hypothetical protein
MNASVGAMLVHDDRLVVAGVFTGIGAASSIGLAAWDGDHWAPVTNLPSPSRVSALAVHQGRLVVGGSFASTSVVLCDGAFVQALGPHMGEATSLASIRGHLFAGVYGDPGGVLEWDGTTWVPLDGDTNGGVEALVATADDRLYAGGAFTMAGTRSSFGIARWDGLATKPDVAAILSIGTGVPNPFRRSVTFAYRLAVGGKVRTAVVDLGGREIAVLEDEQHAPGIHSVEWDGRDSRGRDVRPGVYFVRAQMPGNKDRVWRLVRLQ